MTGGQPARLHLCVLVNDRSLGAQKKSLSCLEAHPEVPLTLVGHRAHRNLEKMARYARRRHHNPVNVVDLADAGRFGSDGDGTLFVFMPGGDWLSDDALGALSKVVHDDDPDIVYFDQDHIDEHGRLVDPWFKPDPSYDYLLGRDYVGPLLCIGGSLLAGYGGIDLSRYPAARYELLLRAFSERRLIKHLALPVYHSLPSSPPGDGAGEVLRRHLRAVNGRAEVLPCGAGSYRIRRAIEGSPKVSIVIPFRDKPALLRQCVTSIIDNTRYSNFEVIGISNRSRSATVYRLMRDLSGLDPRVVFCQHNIPFNFSALVNHGVARASGDYLVLMNNDISVVNDEWLEAMLEHGQREEIGVVGAKLLYPNHTVQHAGLSIQRSGYVGHLHKRFAADSRGYMDRLACVQNVSAVTGALCLFRKQVYQRLGGFDEHRFKIAFNDVDFCLRAEALGYTNVFTPHALAYHHESFSRGYEDTKRKELRFAREQATFARIYRRRIERGDPYYNPNLDQHRDDFSY